MSTKEDFVRRKALKAGVELAWESVSEAVRSATSRFK